MYTNPSQRAYAQAQGTTGTNGAIRDIRDPNENDVNYPLGQFWINQKDIKLWYLNKLSNQTTPTNPSGALQAIWEPISVAGGVLNTLSGNVISNVATPSLSTDNPAFNIQLLGGSGIDVALTGTHQLTITNTGSGTETLTGNDGVIVGPSISGNINTIGGTTIYVTGNAGTNTESFDVVSTNHTILVGRGSPTASVPLAVGTDNTVLLGHTGNDPSWGQVPNGALVNDSVTLNSGNNITVTGGGPLTLGGTASFNLTGTTNHDVQIGNASGSLTSITNGTTGQVLTAVTGLDPIWAAPAASSVTSVSGTNGVTASPTTGAVVVSGVDATTSTLGVASFNPAQFSVSSGAVSLLNGSSITGLVPDTHTPPGTTPVIADGSGNINIKGGPLFGTGTISSAVRTDSITANSMNIELQLAGANIGSSTPNNFGVAQFNQNNFGVTAGFVSSNNFTVNAGAGLTGGGSLTLGGSITLAATGAGFAYNDESTNFSAASNAGYLVTGTATATLPGSPAQSDIIKFIVNASATLTLQAAGGKTIRLGKTVTAANGTCVSSGLSGDAIEIVYQLSTGAWLAQTSIGTWILT